MNKAYKIKLYPAKKQEELINKTIGCSRFIYNQMLSERIKVYEELKNDKEKLYTYKYKTEKDYKQEFEWLNEVSSYALQQSSRDLFNAYQNFFKRVKQKNKKVGFPKFKSKKIAKQSFRICQTDSKVIQIKDNKIKLSKYGFIKFKGLSNNFQGIIKSVTVTKNKDNSYEASILVDQNEIKKERISDNRIGIDLGLKEFVVCSNGETIKGIKNKLYEVENKIKKQQKHFSRKQNESKRKEKSRIKLAKLFQYKTNFQNHFFWHLVNKLCSENKVISLENLNVVGMLKNHKLAHSISYSGWSNFVNKLEQKAKDYETQIIKIDRFFPSSKLCSNCGQIKENLTLADRIYICDCGLKIDRDLNAAKNILKTGLNALSLEYSDYKHGENVRPKEIIYNFNGQFSEKCLF
jgi:putative transposase